MMEVAVSCKSDSNNILMSGIVPHCDKLNAKSTQVNIHLKNEFYKRNIFFMDNSNIISGMIVIKVVPTQSKSRINKLIERICLPWVNSAIDVIHRWEVNISKMFSWAISMKILNEINLSQKMNGLKILSEIKLDLSFPDSQFSIPGYRIFRKNWNKNGGGIWFYINEGIPFKVIESKALPET